MPFRTMIKSVRAYTRKRRSTSLQASAGDLGRRLAEVAAKMWDLGFTAFGGPPVHFQILHRRFVDGKGRFGAKWIDEQTVGHHH